MLILHLTEKNEKPYKTKQKTSKNTDLECKSLKMRSRATEPQSKNQKKLKTNYLSTRKLNKLLITKNESIRNLN